MRRPDLTRGQLSGFLGGAAVVGGAAGWLLLGPLWTIAGVVAGPPFALVACATFFAFAVTEPATHLQNHEPHRALTEISRGLWSWRYLARIWPSQFRQPLADTLLTQAEALGALHREAQALSSAAEAVAIYQVLAAGKPRKFTPGLAGALDRQSSLLSASGRLAEAEKAIAVAVRLYRDLVPAAPGDYLPGLADALTRQAEWLLDMGQDSAALAPASEAADICQDQLPRDALPPCAAHTLLLTGRLLAGQARYREATRPLARGWQLAARHGRQDLLASAVLAVRATYQADDAALRAAWRTETGGEPPDWVNGLPQRPPCGLARPNRSAIRWCIRSSSAAARSIGMHLMIPRGIS
jgi:tetratricopeptide (TPR) repeat protein